MTQPTPQPNDREHVQTRAIEQLTERYRFGVDKYKTGLQVGNGRRMSKDYREEIQDALVYATGMEMVDEEIIKIIKHLAELHVELPIQEGDDASLCNECLLEFPCHTQVDLQKILDLLGVKHD